MRPGVSYWRVPSSAWVWGGEAALSQGPVLGRGLERHGDSFIPQTLQPPPPAKSLLLSWPALCHLAHLLPPEGSVPLLSSPERALPELHFWDNSTLLGLAPFQLPPTLPDSLWLSEAGPRPVPSRRPVPWRGAGRRQLGQVVRAAVSPVPSHCATPTPRPGAPSRTGQADVPGCFPHGYLPDGRGSPTGYV